MIDRVEAVDPLTVRIVTKYPFGAFEPTIAHVSSAIVSPAVAAEHGKALRQRRAAPCPAPGRTGWPAGRRTRRSCSSASTATGAARASTRADRLPADSRGGGARAGARERRRRRHLARAGHRHPAARGQRRRGRASSCRASARSSSASTSRKKPLRRPARAPGDVVRHRPAGDRQATWCRASPRPSTSALTPIMRGYANLGEIPYDPEQGPRAAAGGRPSQRLQDQDRHDAALSDGRRAGRGGGGRSEEGRASTPRSRCTTGRRWSSSGPGCRRRRTRRRSSSWAPAPRPPTPTGACGRSSGPRPTNENNYGYYSNAEFDRVIEAAMRETDAAKRQALYRRAQEIVYLEDPGAVWLFDTLYSVAARKAVSGLRPIAARRRDLRARRGHRSPERLACVGLATTRRRRAVARGCCPCCSAISLAGLLDRPRHSRRPGGDRRRSRGVARHRGADPPRPRPRSAAAGAVRDVRRAARCSGDLGMSIRTGAPVGQRDPRPPAAHRDPGRRRRAAGRGRSGWSVGRWPRPLSHARRSPIALLTAREPAGRLDAVVLAGADADAGVLGSGSAGCRRSASARRRTTCCRAWRSACSRPARWRA